MILFNRKGCSPNLASGMPCGTRKDTVSGLCKYLVQQAVLSLSLVHVWSVTFCHYKLGFEWVGADFWPALSAQGGGVLAASAKTFDLNIRMKHDQVGFLLRKMQMHFTLVIHRNFVGRKASGVFTHHRIGRPCTLEKEKLAVPFPCFSC